MKFKVNDILDYSEKAVVTDPFIITNCNNETYTVVHLSDGYTQSQLSLKGDRYYLRKDLMFERQMKEIINE